jgi:DNA mismatch endonuclease (patch repair protein)
VTFNGPNRHLWEQKISANRARDESNVRLLNLEGWTVLRFWECQVKADALACAAQVGAAAASPKDD